MLGQVLSLLLFGAPAPLLAERAPAEQQKDAWLVRVLAVARDRVSFQVEARRGYHLNDDYPIHVRVVPSDGVRVPRPRVDRAAGTLAPCPSGGHQCKITLPAVVDGKPGALVTGTVAFSVCNVDQCLIEKISVATTLPPM